MTLRQFSKTPFSKASTSTRYSTSTDIIDLTLSEVANIIIDSLLNDPITISISEQAVVLVYIETTDSLTVSIEGFAAVYITIQATEQLITTTSEQKFIAVSNSGSDPPIITLDSLSSVETLIETHDILALALIEQINIQIDTLLNDPLNVALAENLSLNADHLLSDNLNVLLGEATVISIDSLLLDNCYINLSEEAQLYLIDILEDTLFYKLQESQSLFVELYSNDTLAINASDIVKNIGIDNLLLDAFNINISEVSNVRMLQTFTDLLNTDIIEAYGLNVTIDKVDNINYNLSESTVVNNELYVNDSLAVDMTLNTKKDLYNFDNDTIELSLSELIANHINIVVSDNITIDLQELLVLDLEKMFTEIVRLRLNEIALLNFDTVVNDNELITIDTNYILEIKTSDSLNIAIDGTIDLEIAKQLYVKDIFGERKAPYYQDIALHHDATKITDLNNNDRVITWNDISGNHIDANQIMLQGQQPRYIVNGMNNLPIVRFNRNNLEYLISSYKPTGGTVFVVCRLNTGFTNVVRGFLGMSGTPRYYMALNAADRITTGRGDNFGTSTQVFINNIPYLFVMNYESNQNNVYNLLTSYNNYTSNFVGSNSNNMYIGNVNTIGNSYLHGDIAEIIIYNRNLTTAERIAVTNHLDGKWQVSQTQVLEPIVPLQEHSIIDVEHLNYDNFDITMLENIKEYDRTAYDNVLLSLAQILYLNVDQFVFDNDILNIDIQELSYIYYWHKLLYPLESDIIQSKTGVTLQQSQTIAELLESKNSLTLQEVKIVVDILDSRTKIEIKRWN